MPATALSGSGRVDVMATGLVELFRDGRAKRDNRLRYDGAVFLPGQRLKIDRRDVRRLAKKGQLQVMEDLPTPQWWEAEGRVLQREPGLGTVQATAPSPSALRIVQGTGYDPGNAVYRFHSAVNEHSPHASAFVRFLKRNNNPFDCPTQYNACDLPMVRALLLSADVVHLHVDPILTQNAGLSRQPRTGQTIIRHYHGTRFGSDDRQMRDEDQWPMLSESSDDLFGYTLVGARLTLCALRPGRIQWLPITVPVSRYSAMAQGRPRDGVFRIAHSPTRSAIKGTREFVASVKRLQKRGLPVEAVLIKDKTHAEALTLRAACDATFDSFALGIQGSGLEAAAMSQPVIAGDSRVRELYENEVGYCPYTFADDGPSLESTIERLVVDAEFRAAESDRVGAYCLQYHDYPAVARRYSDILTAAGARPLD